MGLRFGAFTFHADRRQLLRGGAEVHLTPKAFDLLTLLIERSPAVVPKPEIHARLWPNTFVSDATLTGLVKELRRALGDDHVGAIVRTAHRVGYAFAGQEGTNDTVQAAPRSGSCLMVGTRRVALREGTNVIGRDPAADVWIEGSGISCRHARIVLENGVASLEDLGSKNGTLLNDRPVKERVALRDSDRIQLANEAMTFRTSASALSTTTVPVRARSSQEE